MDVNKLYKVRYMYKEEIIVFAFIRMVLRMSTNEAETLFYGTVVAFLADTLAAHEIKGFKIGVGFALCKCRVCLANSETMLQTEVRMYIRSYMPENITFYVCNLSTVC